MHVHKLAQLRCQPRRAARGLLIAGLAVALSFASLDAAAGDAMGGWTDLGNGALVQNQTHMRWTRNDNGRDIGWEDARAYCAGMGMGWRLPTPDELTELYAAARRDGDHATCGTSTCQASPLFHLSSNWYWSDTALTKAEAEDYDELAWGLLLVNGRRTQALKDAVYGSRALCVRGR